MEDSFGSCNPKRTKMKTNSEAKRWLSAIGDCDFCFNDLKEQEFFVDGATRMHGGLSGPWGLMCPACHARHGRGLGVGCGQKYSSTPPFLLLEGGFDD